TTVSSIGFSGTGTEGAAGAVGNTTLGRCDALSVGAGIVRSLRNGVRGSIGRSGTVRSGAAGAFGSWTLALCDTTCDGDGTVRSFFGTVSSGFGGSGGGKGPASAIWMMFGSGIGGWMTGGFTNPGCRSVWNRFVGFGTSETIA